MGIGWGGGGPGGLRARLSILATAHCAGEAKLPLRKAGGEDGSEGGASGSDDDEDGSDDEEEGEEGGGGEGEGGEGEEGNRFSKRAMKKWRRALQKKMDEYYRLDAEDFVAGLPCRFKYKPVKPDMYGLKLEEVLLLEDKELNQVVSIKKMAPYRDDEEKPQYGGKRERALAALRRVLRERLEKTVRKGGRRLLSGRMRGCDMSDVRARRRVRAVRRG